jgi:hypothetical protein
VVAAVPTTPRHGTNPVCRNASRASVERVIAHMKNWRILATGYRGMLHRFP